MRTVTSGCGALLVAAGSALGGDPAGDWCRTMDVWQSMGGAHVPVGGTCPIAGQCDLPEVRDGFIPDETTTLRTVRVHLVVFRDDFGGDPAATEQEVVDQMIRMNDDFAPSRFAFQYTWEYVNDSTFRYGGDDSMMKELYALEPEVQCNVFVKQLGYAYGTFPWSPGALTSQGGIVVDENMFGGDTSVMSHEMGHNLGLWHTHHGVAEVPACSACWEQADGVDGDTTGDFCGDTPPTPLSHACTDPSGSDQCSGTPWGETLPESYMSYGTLCWSLFTGQQAGRMQCWFGSVLTGWLVTCLGDANQDGTVGVTDFLGLLGAWGTGDPAYDIDPAGGDGVVGIGDFLGMLGLWGPCPPWEPQPPGNDSCAQAALITGAITPFDTTGATTDGPPLPVGCDEGGGLEFEGDIWYLYVPECTGTAYINTCFAANFDNRLAAYTGACGDLSLVACSDDGACGDDPSMQFPVSCGQAYLIRVGGNGSVTGSGTLFASCLGACAAPD